MSEVPAMSKPKITLMLVDDQHLFREGIKSLLKAHEEVQVVAEAADGQTALDLASREAPDVILLDLKMPGMDGMECCRRLKEQSPTARIVILTVSRELASIVEAMKSGASGYLTKDTPSEKVVETVIRVFHEGNLLEPLLADRLLDEFVSFSAKNEENPEAAMFASLSPRETQILKLVAEGMPNKLIASDLKISEHTVRNHISNIFQKLQVNNRTEATVLAMKQGLV